MAGLFDDKSLKAPPLMGAKARNKLNKHGYYRMPPNMKGIHSAAEGGLGGAITKGRKLRGYAEGGLVDITDQEPNEIRGIGGSDMLIGGSGDDDLGVGGIAPTPLDDEQPNYEEALSDVEKKARINQGATNLGQIMAAMQQRKALTQQYLDNYKQSREGGVNLPALQFAAGLMSPTRTGSFGESMGAGIGMGAQALAQQRKEDDNYNMLKTKLGIESAGQNVDDLIKLRQAESSDIWHQLQYDLARDKFEAKSEYKPTSTEQKEIEAMSKSAPINARIAKQLEEAIPLVNKVGTGPLMGSSPIMAIKKAGLFPNVESGEAAKLQNTMKNLQAMAAKYLNEGQGAVSNYERELYKLATGDTDVPEDTLVGLMQEMQLYFSTQARKSSEWQAYREKNPKGTYTDFTAQFGATAAEDFTPDEQPEDISKLSQEDLEKEIEKERQKAQQ